MTEIPFDLPRATALLTAIADGADTARENRQSFEVSPNVTAELRSIAARLLSGERALTGQLTAIDIKPRESPKDVRITFNIEAEDYMRRGRLTLSGDAEILFLESRAARSSEGSPNT